MTKPIWGGVFSGQVDAEAQGFIVDSDQQKLDTLLLPYYLIETTAHVEMLCEQGILAEEVGGQLVAALGELAEKVKRGEYLLDAQLGDVHENVEQYLIQTLGEVGKQVHTARSRNDQIETDTRLMLRDQLGALHSTLDLVVGALLTLAGEHLHTVMPGYTHMQPAQPMSAGYWLTSYATALCRDRGSLEEVLRRVNILPLGAGAAFGVPYPINRAAVADKLGFAGIEGSGLDAISNRGELILETMSVLNLIWLHLGRLAGELILFSTHEFGYVQIGEQFTSGSSIMPQKRNQDVLELMRAQSSIVSAEYHKCLSLLQKLPSGYQRDTRETKGGLLVLLQSIQALALWQKLIPTITFDAERLSQSFASNFATATDLADALVRDFDLPFRDAHAIVGELVREGGLKIEGLQHKVEEKTGKTLVIQADWLRQALDPLASVERRRHDGGTAPESVQRQIESLRKIISIYP